MSVTNAKLDFWIDKNLNVLFSGKHGVGKTAMIIDAFTRHGLNWKYFSASTMDPWVDFIGVPKANEDEKGQYLDLVLPKDFRDDEIEAIFLDEYNRSPKKVRNAVMELIQFSSINGRKFKKLRCIWAAINPADDDDSNYDVEPLDPAQADRFHIQVSIPYRPSKAYFTKTFGAAISKASMSWWEGLPVETRNLVSPRRLDYAMQIYTAGGDLRDVLPISSNVSKLITVLKTGPVADRLKTFWKNKDVQGVREFLSPENHFSAAVSILIKDNTLCSFCLPALSEERISILIFKDDKILKTVLDRCSDEPYFLKIMQNIFHANKNNRIIRKIKKELKYNIRLYNLIQNKNNNKKNSNKKKKNPDPPIFNIRSKYSEKDIKNNLSACLKAIQKSNLTQERNAVLESISKILPANLGPEIAIDTLNLLNQYARRSQVVSLCNNRYFVGLLNHVIMQICLFHKCNYETFVRVSMQCFDHIGHKINQSELLYSKIISPTKEEIEKELLKSGQSTTAVIKK